jgi:cytochrome b involved in lipid metabolism
MKRVTLVFIIIFISSVFGIFVVSNTSGSKESVTVLKANNYSPKYINSPVLDLQSLTKVNMQNKGKMRLRMVDVLNHNRRNDCYLVINGNVYDVSPYMPHHPAGSRIISKYCGGEVTGIFAQIHSNRAWNLLAKYKVGTVDTQAIKPTPQILSTIEKALAAANPDALVMKVAPSKNGYIAKVLLRDTLYEVHMDSSSKIVKEEAADAELSWDSWDTDKDDL